MQLLITSVHARQGQRGPAAVHEAASGQRRGRRRRDGEDQDFVARDAVAVGEATQTGAKLALSDTAINLEHEIDSRNLYAQRTAPIRPSCSQWLC